VSEALSRRRLLGLAVPLGALVACAPTPPEPATAEVPLASLHDGERLVVWRGDEPVELLKRDTTIRARSLWCTHTGCRVVWKTESSTYRCLCHEATFDADGKVLSGPPPRPLRELPVTVRDDLVIVGELAAGGRKS